MSLVCFPVSGTTGRREVGEEIIHEEAIRGREGKVE